MRFNANRARWVAQERWHSKQEGTLRKDSSYDLRVPYADDRELVMDIMKYGGDCEMLAPKALRERVAAEAGRMLGVYCPGKASALP